MIEENKKNYVSYWLFSVILLIYLMIVVGGLTRLTDSGLSITRWDLITGILPPLNLQQWDHTFSLYKKIPEFKLLNPDMSLTEFKVIYWWEYIHRLLGRVIGLAYLMPLIYFTYKKSLNKNNLYYLYFILFLICFQGFVGWYMVKSGLVENTDVSHYLLSLHLTIAFIILVLLIWGLLTVINLKAYDSIKKIPYKLTEIFVFLILLQISLGGLVSGLDAGTIYQSWPLMNENYFPDDSKYMDLFLLSALETPSLVQFLHRNLAYLIIILSVLLAYLIYKNNKFERLKKIFIIVLLALFFQTLLGILTILSGAQIFLASLHQIGSIFLVSSSIILIFKNYKTN